MKKETAVFAAGCFWGVEYKFGKLPGVLETRVGYTGGDTKNPTYEEVCSDDTGHAEAVEVIFDPAQISFKELVIFFFGMHDPTTLNSQGPDHGTQYRSAIFCHGQEQMDIANQAKTSFKGMRKAVTQITDAVTFYPAEEYHQKYNIKNNRHFTCS